MKMWKYAFLGALGASTLLLGGIAATVRYADGVLELDDDHYARGTPKKGYRIVNVKTGETSETFATIELAVRHFRSAQKTEKT